MSPDRSIFSHPPRWVAVLAAVRDALVSTVGLKTGVSLRSSGEQRDRIGIFRLHDALPSEGLLGEDDKDLDFRASVLCWHNLLGRTSIMLVAPFHRRVASSCLRRAARIGWPDEIAASTVASGVGV